MSFDIYGQPLRRGHCEVHPDVHEVWPCFVCIQENRLVVSVEREYQSMMAQYEQEHYAAMEMDYASEYGQPTPE